MAPYMCLAHPTLELCSHTNAHDSSSTSNLSCRTLCHYEDILRKLSFCVWESAAHGERKVMSPMVISIVSHYNSSDVRYYYIVFLKPIFIQYFYIFRYRTCVIGKAFRQQRATSELSRDQIIKAHPGSILSHVTGYARLIHILQNY